MKTIFISYDRADTEYARQLSAYLRDVNVAGWMDNADIAAGDEIARSVREAIRKASAIVVLISKRSLESRWVRFELGAGQAMEKPIIPILVKGSDVDRLMPDWLKETQYLDARGRPFQEVARELADVISDGGSPNKI